MSDSSSGPSSSEPAHLARSAEAAALLGLEFAAVQAQNAFREWVGEVHRTAGGPSMPVGDVLLLHSVRLCPAPRTLTALRQFTRAHAIPLLAHGLRRLVGQGLIERQRIRGEREYRYELTGAGTALTDRYADWRDAALVTLASREARFVAEATTAAQMLQRLSALYRQAARALQDRAVLDAAR